MTLNERHIMEVIELILVDLQNEKKLSFTKQLVDVSKNIDVAQHQSNIVSIFHVNELSTIDSTVIDNKLYISNYIYIPLILPDMPKEMLPEIILNNLMYYEAVHRFKCVLKSGKILFENILCVSDFGEINDWSKLFLRNWITTTTSEFTAFMNDIQMNNTIPDNITIN